MSDRRGHPVARNDRPLTFPRRRGIRWWAVCLLRGHDEYESSATTRVGDVRHDIFVCRRCKRIRVGGPTR